MRNSCDYLIIGAGSAGSTLAGRLSEDPERRVLLIEAGGRDASPLMHVPGLLEGNLISRRANWHYLGDPDPTLGGRQLTWAAGRVLGGSSSINGMVYGRGLPADYQRWVAAGAEGWGWDDMQPYFRRMEHWTGVGDAGRGRGGPVWVRRFEETDRTCASAMAALVSLGVPTVADYCAGVAEGIGLTQATQKHGWRHSAATAYLAPARRRPNLKVMTGSHVVSLILEGSRCVGARIVRGGQVKDVFAERETILAAGAVGTPKLLMVSGIGPADAIKPFGYKVIHDLPGVGANLNDHVNIKLSAFVDRPTYNTRRKGWRAVGEALQFALSGTGAASSPANHGQAFVRTDPSMPSADVQLQVMPLGFGTPAQMARDGLTIVVSPCHPEARGRIRLRSSDPTVPPRITMAMLSSERDVARLLRGCKLAHTALLHGPGRDMGGKIYAPAEASPTDETWLAFFRETAALNWHPTSSCRMGVDDGAVVDLALRVRGLTGLSIADASVMPSVTSGNTNGPVIAIAERAAALIAARTA